jgi:hypothetical protein
MRKTDRALQDNAAWMTQRRSTGGNASCRAMGHLLRQRAG